MTQRATFPVANAPCSWGVIGGDTPMTPFRTMLDELASSGYVGTELGDYGYMATDADVLNEELAKRKLTMLGAFVPVHFTRDTLSDEDVEQTLTVARLLAATSHGPRKARVILADADGQDPIRSTNAGRVTPAMRLDDDTMARFARNVDRLAEIVQAETGLATAFHPHCAGWIETPDEVDALLAATHPDRVNLVFDTAHHVYGTGRDDADGQSAVQGIERFWGRIDTVHVKDCSREIARTSREDAWTYDASVRAGLYCELGKGSIDFGAVLATLERLGYQDWLTVEQDVFPDMGTPLESARRNRAYLASLGV